MQTYVILRREAWSSAREAEEAHERAAVEGERLSELETWVRSYVLEEWGGSLGSICIYKASGPEAIRRHSAAAELPVDEIVKVAGTVIVHSADAVSTTS
jgi:hypothetical protein